MEAHKNYFFAPTASYSLFTKISLVIIKQSCGVWLIIWIFVFKAVSPSIPPILPQTIPALCSACSMPSLLSPASSAFISPDGFCRWAIYLSIEEYVSQFEQWKINFSEFWSKNLLSKFRFQITTGLTYSPSLLSNVLLGHSYTALWVPESG